MKITALLSRIMLIEMASKSHIPESEVLVRRIGGGGRLRGGGGLVVVAGQIKDSR